MTVNEPHCRDGAQALCPATRTQTIQLLNLLVPLQAIRALQKNQSAIAKTLLKIMVMMHYSKSVIACVDDSVSSDLVFMKRKVLKSKRFGKKLNRKL